MAQIVNSHVVECRECGAKVIVLVWSCGCVQVVNPNRGVEQETPTFGHSKECTHKFPILTGFERLCGNDKLLDRQEDPPCKH